MVGGFALGQSVKILAPLLHHLVIVQPCGSALLNGVAQLLHFPDGLAHFGHAVLRRVAQYAVETVALASCFQIGDFLQGGFGLVELRRTLGGSRLLCLPVFLGLGQRVGTERLQVAHALIHRGSQRGRLLVAALCLDAKLLDVLLGA